MVRHCLCVCVAFLCAHACPRLCVFCCDSETERCLCPNHDASFFTHEWTDTKMLTRTHTHTHICLNKSPKTIQTIHADKHTLYSPTPSLSLRDPLLSGSLVDQNVFKYLVIHRLPKLAAHLTEIKGDDSLPILLSTEWFMCLFSRTLPSETTFRSVIMIVCFSL